MNSIRCVFTVDVEDWFHILDVPSAPSMAGWDQLPSRVEVNFRALLDIFAEGNIPVTCFFLGWVARRFPHLVRLAVERGHEVASHGYAHRLVYRMTEAEFYEDAVRARETIEDAAGAPVLGYRASGFSVTGRTPWFFETLRRAGYTYDSSIFPGTRGHGGMPGAGYAPHVIETARGPLVEFPITLTKLIQIPICLFGGGYLRLAPWALIRRGAQKVLGEGRPVVFYVHPREIDPAQPRLEMAWTRRFKSYVNLSTTESKIRNIMSDFQFAPFGEFLPAVMGQSSSKESAACR